MRRAGARRPFTFVISVAFAAALGVTAARAAEPVATPTLAGLWTAMNSGKQIFRGQWSADVALATPNVALGTWSLTDERARVVMGGTWSARKTPGGWRGAWSARVGDSKDVLSGTWEADDSTLRGAKTFRDLLARTAEKQIAGVWRMGHAHGTWWLQHPS